MPTAVVTGANSGSKYHLTHLSFVSILGREIGTGAWHTCLNGSDNISSSTVGHEFARALIEAVSQSFLHG